MAGLTGMDISNASLYDGASGLAEACLMAVRANRKSKSQRILLPVALNPTYRSVLQAIAGNQSLAFELVPYDQKGGQTIVGALDKYRGQDITAVVIQQPNFFGTLEDVDAVTDWAHDNNALAIGVVMVGVQIVGLPLATAAGNVADLFGENDVGFDLPLNGILAILLVFILAGIFERGAEMREELEGTV